MDAVSKLQRLLDLRQKDFPTTDEWGVMERGCELAGETGELCNLLKKIDRDMIPEKFETSELFWPTCDELGDVLITTLLVANYLNIDLVAAAVDKFNKTSEKIGSDVSFDYGYDGLCPGHDNSNGPCSCGAWHNAPRLVPKNFQGISKGTWSSDGGTQSQNLPREPVKGTDPIDYEAETRLCFYDDKDPLETYKNGFSAGFETAKKLLKPLVIFKTGPARG